MANEGVVSTSNHGQKASVDPEIDPSTSQCGRLTGFRQSRFRCTAPMPEPVQLRRQLQCISSFPSMARTLRREKPTGSGWLPSQAPIIAEDGRKRKSHRVHPRWISAFNRD